MRHPHHDAFKMWFYKREIAAQTFPDISGTRCSDLCCGLRASALQEVKCDQRRQWGIGEHWSLHTAAPSGGKCVSLLLFLTSGCRCTRRSCIACATCRWAPSNHTCVPVTSCRLACSETSDEAQERKISQTHPHAQIWVQEHTQEYMQKRTQATAHAPLK